MIFVCKALRKRAGVLKIVRFRALAEREFVRHVSELRFFSENRHRRTFFTAGI